MAYNEDELRQILTRTPYNSNESGSFQRNATHAWDAYLDQLSPNQLQERYKYFADQGVGDLGSYNQQKYGFGDAKDAAYYAAYKNFKDIMGRDPNANELSQAATVFYNPADYGSGIASGRGYLSSLAERDKADPTKQGTKGQGFYGTVNDSVSQILGRQATPEEQSHFGNLLSSGQLDAYTLKQFLQSQPEYQQTQDTNFRQGLSKELQGYDTDFFNKAKEDVISRYAQNGTMGSSALDYALTDLMGNIQKQRGSYLADLSAKQYGSNKDSARQDYMTQMNNYLGNQQYNRQRGDATSDYYRDRSAGAYDYATQRNDYMNYLNSQSGRGRTNYGAAFGPLLGAGIGALGAGLMTGGMGAPAGAQLGAYLGGAGGSTYDYLR